MTAFGWNLLADAAELEHSAACQYLFLAFSMKRHPDERRHCDSLS